LNTLQRIDTYQVLRCYKAGFKPQVMESGLTQEAAWKIARHNNGKADLDNLPRTWYDIVQKEL